VGIIIKQTIRGSIWSYLGVGLGFLNLAIISPKVFSTEQIGLTQILVAMAVILSQFASLGFNNVTTRLFPYFRNEKNGHNGFLFLSLSVALFGFILVLISLKFILRYIIEDNLEKSPLLSEYAYYLIPLIFFYLLFTVFDNYNRVLFDAVLGTFLKEFLVRLLNLGAILLFYFDIIEFDLFIFLYVFVMAVPMVYLLIHLISKKRFNLRPQLRFLSPDLKKQILDLCIFGIIIGLSGYALANIDKYMINEFIDLGAVGIYSIAFYFGTLILIPTRSLNKIAVPIIAESWKNKDLNNIKDIYYKSSINQFVFGLLLFVGIWVNIDNIFRLLPEEYSFGRWVILYIGIANVITSLSGSSIYILATSAFYRFQSYFMILLILLVVITNLIFIPLYGITGAALASLISTLIYVSVRMFFLHKKFNMWPMKRNHLLAILVASLAFIISSLLPYLENLWVDLFVRSTILLISYSLLTLALNISEELTLTIKNYSEKLFNALRK
jgi:O-antigen/teichoic acid export membrane protein